MLNYGVQTAEEAAAVLENWAEILVGMPCPEYIPTLSAKKTLGQLALKVVSKSKLVFKVAAHSGSASHAS